MASSSLCRSWRNFTFLILSLVPVIAAVCACSMFGYYGVLSISISSTTFFILLASTVFIFAFPKQKSVLAQQEHPEEEEVISSLKNNQEVVLKQGMIQQPQPGNEMKSAKNLEMRSPDLLYSDDQSLYSSSSSSGDSDGWPCSGNLCQSPDCSDGSISDEESLIEIEIPSGHYLGSEKEEDPINDMKFSLQQYDKFMDFSEDSSIFQKRNLMELLAEINEMNEEENLIEIDISMGSIKCSRFEIEA